MATIDPEQERRRLAEVYSRQTDGELEQTATQGDKLTDVARETLDTELARRGLSARVDQERGNDQGEPEFRDLITVRSFWSLPEANMAKGLLDAAGIESFLFDENVVGLGWYANAVHGVKLRVDRERAEEADRVLKEFVSDVVESEEPESSP